MTRRLLAVLAAAPLVVGSFAVAAPAAAMLPEREPAGTYVVTLAPGTGAVAGLVEQLATRYGGTVGFTYGSALRGFSVSLPSPEASALALDPLVAAVEPAVPMSLNDVQGGAQYDLDRTDQRSGLDGKYTYNATGLGVTAYVLDTGIRASHAQFGGRASAGFDAIGDGRNGVDCHGHGTHTAGTVAASTYGMAKRARVVGVRVLDCDGSGTSDEIIAGLDWVAARAVKPAVANMSIGTNLGRSSAIDAAVRGLVNRGVPIAVSAGNGYGNGLYQEDACTHSPSGEPMALTVSAVDSRDTKPVWANYGTCVDLFAGGVDVNSSWHTSDTATRLSSGTSMSSPHVAGAAALYLQMVPTATPGQVATFLTSQATSGAVKSAGSGSPNKLLYVGGISAGSSPSPSPSPSTSPSPSPSPTGTDPDPATPTLTSGVARSDTNGASGSWKHYKVAVPNAGRTVTLTLSGPSCGLLFCSPDLDLYGRNGAKPTTTTYSCSSAKATNSESCTISNAPAGYAYVGVYVYSGSAGSAYTVRATVT